MISIFITSGVVLDCPCRTPRELSVSGAEKSRTLRRSFFEEGDDRIWKLNKTHGIRLCKRGLAIVCNSLTLSSFLALPLFISLPLSSLMLPFFSVCSSVLFSFLTFPIIKHHLLSPLFFFPFFVSSPLLFSSPLISYILSCLPLRPPHSFISVKSTCPTLFIWKSSL